MDILERIDELRKERGWSVNNLAMEAGLTQSTLNNLYTRKTEPKLSTLRSVCYAFEISLAEFFAGSDYSDKPILSKEQEELLRLFGKLNGKQKEALLSLLEALTIK